MCSIIALCSPREALEILRALVRTGANVNRSESGRTPLYVAAQDGHVELVKELLKARADTSICNNDGETALHAAAGAGHADVVSELLKAKANVNVHDKNGETPAGIAFNKGHYGIVYLLLRTTPLVWPHLEKSICSK